MTERKNNIHYSLQVVPLTDRKSAYTLIDECLALIDKSGLRYITSPMETTVQGPYEELVELQNKIHSHLLNSTEEFLINIKIHSRKSGDVTFEEKGL